jgi:hypothetical protein
MRKNRQELSGLIATDNMKLYDSLFFWNDESSAMLVKYQCKPKRSVFLLSTMHSSPTTDNTGKKKPAVIHFYNENKIGVDVVDQMTRLYTTKCASRRWPVAVWHNILDIAAINAWVIYREATKNNLSRKLFILQLMQELIGSSQQGEETNIAAKSDEIPDDDKSSLLEKRKQCRSCRNKTAHVCCECHKPVCGSCAALKMKQFIFKCNVCA